MDFYAPDKSQAIRQWIQDRVANIHASVSAGDVLTRHGKSLRWHGDREEQISCPFHGEDKNPSARYYPDGDDNRSHVWCFACQKSWDTIGLWLEFNGKEDRFSQTLWQIERAFGLTAPEAQMPDGPEAEPDPLEEEVGSLLDACETRMRANRDAFDMDSHLKLGSMLDRIRHAKDNKILSLEETKDRLTKILDKIGEKVRAKETIDT